jgi:hypothetical protein
LTAEGVLLKYPAPSGNLLGVRDELLFEPDLDDALAPERPERVPGLFPLSLLPF